MLQAAARVSATRQRLFLQPSRLKSSWLPAWVLKEHIVAKPSFNRWLVVPASVSMHLSIGSVYAWSVMNTQLTRELGVVASAAGDWSLSGVVPIFSAAIASLGLSAALTAQWLEKVGPRAVGLAAAACWGGGLVLGSVGVAYHSLPLLYLGYGALGGMGLGMGYVSPVSTLIRWFPDRRGLATGLAILGFGGGAMIAAPLKESLIKYNFQAPTFMGTLEDLTSSGALVSEHGVRYVKQAGRLVEVVLASATDAAVYGVPEGLYAVGTGSTGCSTTFAVLGSAYFVVMSLAALSYRVPAEGWRPAGWTPPESSGAMIASKSVHINTAMRTPQFWLLWTNLCCNVTAGIGVLACAKTMMTDIFGTSLPQIVNSTFAANFVLAVSLFNTSGRLFWASASDFIGRQRTFAIFFAGAIPLYLIIPWCSQQVSLHSNATPLTVFCGATAIIFTFYGGGFATIPAYLADIFGPKYVGGIHGRLLSAWSAAGVLGPLAITQLRDHSYHQALDELARTVDPRAFETHFGAPVSELPALAATRTVTISKLMDIVPPGTIDPTPFLYDTTMYTMAGVLAVGLVSNSLVRPVDAKYHIKEDDTAVAMDAPPPSHPDGDHSPTSNPRV